MARVFALFALAFFVGTTLGSHFRYGTISSVQDSTNPKKVTYSISVAFRRSAFYGNQVGQKLDYAASFEVNGKYYDFSPVITNIDAANDISYASLDITETFASYGTYNAKLSSCCRIGELVNAGGDGWAVNHKQVVAATINNSPRVTILPIVNVPFGISNYQFQVTAIDAENNGLTFALATKTEMAASANQFQPSGLTISASGLVTLTQNLGVGKYSTQQKVTDTYGNVAYVDYIIQVVQGKKYCTGTCGTATPPCSTDGQCQGACTSDSTHTGYLTPSGPQCKDPLPEVLVIDSATNPGASKSTNKPSPANGATLTATAGQPFSVNIVADDAVFYVASSPVAIAFGSLPTRSSTTTQTACNSNSQCSCVGCNSQTQIITLNYNPTDADVGPHPVCLSVTSMGVGLPYSVHCFTIDVISGQVCGNGIIEGNEACDGGDCCTSSCTFYSSVTVCRGANGACDVAETCSGSSSSCPADSFQSASTICRAANGVCDVAETCSGSSGSCPADGFASSSTVCRASISTCDAAESCTGSSSSCPKDNSGDFATACAGYDLSNVEAGASFLDFNVISFNDYFAYSGDVEGRIAVRRSLNVGWGWSAGYELQEGSRDKSLSYAIVSGGDSTFQSGAIYPDGSNVPYHSGGHAENMFIGGNFIGANYLASRKTGTCSTSGCLESNFAAAKQCFSDLSASIASNADNTRTEAIWSTLYINCTSPTSSAYYLSLTPSVMSTYTGIAVSAGCNNHARWYVNIRGSGDVTLAGNQDLPVNAAGVVYNIVGSGRKVNVQTRISGHVVSPTSDINQTGGVIVGKLIANNVVMSIQVNKDQCYVPTGSN